MAALPDLDTRNRSSAESLATLPSRLMATRQATEALVAGLTPEDQNLQSMPEASPAKWHRAHTSWFFETFVLAEHLPGYRVFHPAFAELFNSYYNGVGRQHPRPRRALLSRPTADTVTEYRAHVDTALETLLGNADADGLARLAPLLELGLAHEQQHQELILTDLKHAFSFNPLAPALGTAPAPGDGDMPAVGWIGHDGGIIEIGAEGSAFCFDNETPRHRMLIDRSFEMADRTVSCGEYLEFIDDGGYREPLLWLADGWSWLQREAIDAPLYWQRDQKTGDAGWSMFTLSGRRALDRCQPVCHLSFYEAAAFAAWAGVRLPTEFEWEAVAAGHERDGQFADSGCFHPQPIHRDAGPGLYGGVWEWTASSYAPYPGFRPAGGAIGEYNGKFMANQMVLRGGSCASPVDHVRASYRNFFYPPDRWQFSGLRLARDA
jgi:ergothioneine biosynthesis protein EgtB